MVLIRVPSECDCFGVVSCHPYAVWLVFPQKREFGERQIRDTVPGHKVKVDT